MTKEITKATILQEMQDKLKLREFDPANFLFSETVHPVYNIEQHLQHWKTAYAEQTIMSAVGVTFFTVPQNERWYVNGYNIVFMGAGAYTVSGMYIERIDAGIGVFLYLDLTAAQTVSYAVNLPKVLALNPGDQLNINIDSYTSPQDLRLYIDYMVEEIR